MPIYEYRCEKCGEDFSVIKLVKADDNVVCPSCGAKDVKKKLSSFSSPGSSAYGTSGSNWGGG